MHGCDRFDVLDARIAMADDEIFSAELTLASYQTCSRKLVRGQVKRVLQRGPLIGYFIACPACGFVASYLHDECDFAEAKVGGREILTRIQRNPRCYSCRRVLDVESGRLLAR